MCGFNKPCKRHVVKEWIKVAKPSFGCIVETRVQEKNFKTVFDASFLGWKSIRNYEHHLLGSIWVIQADHVEVTLIYKYKTYNGLGFYEYRAALIFSYIYASNFRADCWVLWSELEWIETTFERQNIPWIVLRDFNENLSSAEHSLFHEYRLNRSGILEFQTAV